MSSNTVPTPAEICDRWQVSPTLAFRVSGALTALEFFSGLEWRIISGFRTPEEQEELIRQGRPAAPVNLSNHTACPALAVDIEVASFPTDSLKAMVGDVAAQYQLRWGGGSPPDENGIPLDWNHLDLGPRSEAERRPIFVGPGIF